MKKVIKGAMYSTQSAERLASQASGLGTHAGFEEALYRTRSGKYFLHGKGGPASRYAEQVQQSAWASGEKIVPLTLEAAKEWAEGLSGEEYEAIFGKLDESQGKVQVSVWLPIETKRKIDRIKDETGKTTTEIISSLLAEALK